MLINCIELLDPVDTSLFLVLDLRECRCMHLALQKSFLCFVSLIKVRWGISWQLTIIPGTINPLYKLSSSHLLLR